MKKCCYNIHLFLTTECHKKEMQFTDQLTNCIKEFSLNITVIIK